jgi:hypothetical protein
VPTLAKPGKNLIIATRAKPVVDAEFWVVESLPANIFIGEDSLNALAAYELNQDEFYSNLEQTAQGGSINRILDVSGTFGKMVAGVRQRLHRPARREIQANINDVEGTYYF